MRGLHCRRPRTKDREPPSGIGLVRERTDEGLSRDTDAHGPPELADPSETGQHGRVPLVPGDTPMPEESDAGIHHDLLRGDPGLGGEMEAGSKYLRHRLHGWARSRCPGLGGHHDQPRAVAGHERSKARVRHEAVHIVDDARARLQGGPRRLDAARIGRDGHDTELARQQPHRPAQAVGLLGRGHATGEIGRGGHGPHVDDGRALGDHALGCAQQLVGGGDHGSRIEGPGADIDGPHHGHVPATSEVDAGQGRADRSGHEVKIPLPRACRTAELRGGRSGQARRAGRESGRIRRGRELPGRAGGSGSG